MNDQTENSNKTTLIIVGVVIVALIGVIIWYLVSQDKPDNSTDDDNEDQIVIVDDDQQDTDADQEEDEITPPDNVSNEEPEENDTPIEPLDDFSTSDQTAGDSEGEPVYTLEEISNSSQGNDYHKLVFSMSNPEEDDGVPYAEAKYDKNKGAIVVTIYKLTKDSSGISPLSTQKINQMGITKLVRGITGKAGQSVYEIGVTEQTPFRLNTDPDNPMNIILDIQYPGEDNQVASDLGDDNVYSMERQEVGNANSEDGASISRFSYASSSGVLTIRFEVGGSSEKPIPQAVGKYEDGTLSLVFPSLKKHQYGDSWNLPKAGTVNLDKDGETSTYTFSNFDDNEFKLTGSLNPNEIVLQVKY